MATALAAMGIYGTTVLPRVRNELRAWRREAAAIPEETLRRQALSALDGKASNVEAVAVFALLAPRANRPAALRAIAALQVAIDYLDTLEEAEAGSLREPDDCEYLARLQAAWRTTVESLPAAESTRALIEEGVGRCEEGQRRTHAAEHGDLSKLRDWALQLPAPRGYRWWELAAGASSSVAAHALIGAAADPGTTPRQAELIDAAYNPSIGALTVLLDSLVDRELDVASSAHNYVAYYADSGEAAERIARIARDAEAEIALLPKRRLHAAVVAGIAGYYASERGAGDPFGKAVAEALRRALGPSVTAIAAVTALRRHHLRPSARKHLTQS